MSTNFPIVWDERYKKLDVTPEELYMRQQGLCYLIAEKNDKGITVYCTDGKDKSETAKLLNPTYECAVCMTKCIKRVIENGIKQEQGTDSSNSTT